VSLDVSPPDSGAGAAVPDNGPAVTRHDFDLMFDELRVRAAPVPGAPGYGALARTGAADRARAATLVRTGRSVSLSLPINRHPAPDNARPALHHMVDRGDVEAPEPTANKDFIGLDYHGKAVTHLDALCHIAYRGELFGGAVSADVVGSHGSRHLPVSALADGIVLRGVLLDLAAVAGVSWLEPGQAVHEKDLLAAASAHGVELRAGDAVLLRSGQQARRAALGPWDPDVAGAGLHPHAMRLLADIDIALLGGDGDSDVRPSPVEGVSSPVHVLALTALGIPLLDNLDLERLSVACREEGRYEFMLVVAPLVVPGGTGSPVNPLAVL